MPNVQVNGANIATNRLTRDGVQEDIQITQIVDVSGVNILTPDATGKIGINSLPGSPAQDGTDASGVTQLTGGIGIRGWLSGIYSKLSNVLNMTISDGVTSANKASVQQFHNSDNQSLATTAYGVLSGGVAQLLNPVNNLDRQRETSFDNVPATGLAAGSQNLASPINVTSSTAIAVGAVNSQITLSAVTGVNRGAAWGITIGSALLLSPGTANQEPAFVSSITGNVVTLNFSGTNNAAKFAHTGTYTIISFAYNQARDATTPDGSAGAGFSASATFLFNSGLNSGSGGWESERSASGELDGASGSGTAVAAEYEFNGGGPLISGISGSFMFDRARSVQGKFLNSTTLGAAVASSATSITLVSASGLLPGMPLLLRGGTQETVYVSTSYVPITGANVVVALQQPAQQAHALGSAAIYDSYASNGPALNGFTAVGMGIEEEALYDPVSDLFYIERAATQDAMPPQNIVAEAAVAWNGTSFDRLRVDANTTGVLRVTSGGSNTISVPATNSAVVIKASAGRLVRVLVTTVGTTTTLIYDNATTASGTIIGVIPANSGIGTIIDLSMPAVNGITAGQTTTSSVFTASYY